MNTTLPHQWTTSVKSAVLQVISLAHCSLLQAHAGTSGKRESPFGHRSEASLLREEVRILCARLALVSPHHRPHYPPHERMAILELKAARGWSLEQTARSMLVTAATISAWMKRIDEQGPEALVRLPKPVNKFPEFVGYLVQRLKTLCPALGKRKAAAMLARTGLHLSATSIGRMLKERPRFDPPTQPLKPKTPDCIVTARHPNHVWHVDLTVAPIRAGFWCPWSPQALPQYWPFCWWIAVVVDHYSRRVMGTATFYKQPTSEQVRMFLGRTMQQNGATPKYLICDKGVQFWNDGFKRWCKRRGIRVRYGAIGKQGSIAVVERFIRTLKESCTRRLLLTPLSQRKLREELALFCRWYNEYRPHETLNGATPNERYYKRFSAHRMPRYEPRSRWPRGSPCAAPWALVRGKPGAKLRLDVTFLEGRRHLPIVTLSRVA
jgi:transposase InsO family protein